MNHTQIVDGQLLEPCSQRATFLQPADAALNHIAPAVAAVVIADRTPAPSLAALGSGGISNGENVSPPKTSNWLPYLGRPDAIPVLPTRPSASGTLPDHSTCTHYRRARHT